MARYLESTKPVQIAVRLYKRFTPTFLHNAFGWVGYAMMHILDDLRLSTLAFVLTKGLRTLGCYLAFGIPKKEKDILLDAILNAIDPQKHSPYLFAFGTLVF